MGSERSESQGQGKLRGPRVNAVSKHWGLGWMGRATDDEDHAALTPFGLLVLE